MVKQFTIPCQFGQETSPVTLYIGHPETTHHPVHFQSAWLSSAKGGVIPQDLMDTLQKLLNLANENGTDFEELCYYALISATQHSAGGVSPEDINKYADEFVQKDGNVNSDINVNKRTVSSDSQTSKEQQDVTSSTFTDTQKQTDNDLHKLNEMSDENNTANDVSFTSDDEDLLMESNDVGSLINTSIRNDGNQEIVSTYSSEDEDLLLCDDLRGF